MPDHRKGDERTERVYVKACKGCGREVLASGGATKWCTKCRKLSLASTQVRRTALFLADAGLHKAARSFREYAERIDPELRAGVPPRAGRVGVGVRDAVAVT